MCRFPDQVVDGKEIMHQQLSCMVSALSALRRSEEMERGNGYIRTTAFLENFLSTGKGDSLLFAC